MHTAPNRYPAALIFGVPGAGKGMQGSILARVPGFFHASSGGIFRELDPDSPDGRRVREFANRGELAPDEVTVRIVLDWLDRQVQSGAFRPTEELLLLDGIPRNLAQCRLLEPSISVKVILHLVCRDQEQMIGRIRRRAQLEGRPDDAQEAVIRKRFEVYREQTAPVLGYYAPPLIGEVNADGTPCEVLRDCLTHLVPVYKASFVRTVDNVSGTFPAVGPGIGNRS